MVAAWQRGLGLDVEDVPPAVAHDGAGAAGILARGLVPSQCRFALGLPADSGPGQRGATARRHRAWRRRRLVVCFEEGNRVTGVRLQDRDIRADTTVLATGAWTRLLGDSLGVSLPTKPVKGQLIAFANAPLRPASVISGHGGYVRPARMGQRSLRPRRRTSDSTAASPAMESPGCSHDAHPLSRAPPGRSRRKLDRSSSRLRRRVTRSGRSLAMRGSG